MVELIFGESLKSESIHLQMDNQAALVFVRKMMGNRGGRWGVGCTVNQKMNQVSKELWKFLIGNGITI